MSLAAFTQQPGHHRRYEVANGYKSGKWYGWEGRELDYSVFYEAERSDKWYPHNTHGQRYPTTYSRSVRKVTINKPMRYHRRQSEGNPPDDYVVIDLRYEDHITNHHAPFSYETPNPGWDNAKNESVVKALNRLVEDKSQLGATLAEARKTTDMAADLAGRAARVLLAMKRRQWENALRGLGYSSVSAARRQFANDLLAFRYGWLPLATDLYNADQLARNVLRKAHQVEGYGVGKSEHHEDFVWSGWLRHRGSNKCSHRSVFRGLVENEKLNLINSLGLSNPLAIAWELVPWSFAIDWFVPVGQTLEAMTASYGLQSQGGWTSSKTDTTLVLTGETMPTGWATVREDGGNYVAKGHTFFRQAYADFPRPQVFADTTPFSTGRALNALALFNQLYKG